MQIEIVLSFQADMPIYEQIETQIRNQIFSGKLEAGTPIPSMRALAKMLKVSVITVQKAYENLRNEGLIESVVGRGTIVSAVNRQAILEARQRELEEKIEDVIRLAKENGMNLDSLQDLVSLLFKEDQQ